MILVNKTTFPNIFKTKISGRGLMPIQVFSPPTIEEVVGKIGEVLDVYVKQSANTELKRFLVKSTFKNKSSYGYICLKLSNVNMANCRNAESLQTVVNSIEQSVIWDDTYPKLIAHISSFCTSPSYLERINKFKF